MFHVIHVSIRRFFFFFFNDTATTEIYTLSLHDALPISVRRGRRAGRVLLHGRADGLGFRPRGLHEGHRRSEEHTSELQSLTNLVCRLLLEKKKRKKRCCLSRLDTYAESTDKMQTGAHTG